VNVPRIRVEGVTPIIIAGGAWLRLLKREWIERIKTRWEYGFMCRMGLDARGIRGLRKGNYRHVLVPLK
jgi:hypothetical protein